MSVCEAHKYLDNKIDVLIKTYDRDQKQMHQDIKHIRNSIETVERHIDLTDKTMREINSREHEAVSFIVEFLQKAGTEQKNIPETPLAKRTARGEFEITKNGVKYNGPNVAVIMLSSTALLLALLLFGIKLKELFLKELF